MSTRKIPRPAAMMPAAAVPVVPGYLGKLTLVNRDQDVPIRRLNACQIRHKNADPATVAKYRDLLSESEPPNIIVIVDPSGRYFIADGHNRTAAALDPDGPRSGPTFTPAPMRTPSWSAWR